MGCLLHQSLGSSPRTPSGTEFAATSQFGKCYCIYEFVINITETSYTNGFYVKVSLFKQLLLRLWQHRTGELPVHGIVFLIRTGAFPLVNYCPWLKAEGEYSAAAVGFLRKYMSISKPLILLTLPEKPSSVPASGFQHTFGYPSNDRVRSKVGFPHQVYHDDCCSIQIPCFHPSRARFSVKADMFFTVLDITLWVLLLTLSVCIDPEPQYFSENREDWCIDIK